MAKKIDYASLYTLRKDGRYMGYWKDQAGKRHAVYNRDPEALYFALLEKSQVKEEEPEIVTFKRVSDEWEREHREQIEIRTWKNYAPHVENIVSIHGKKPFEDVTAMDVVAHLARAKAQNRSATVIRTIRSIYSMIFDYAVVHGYAPYNPIGSVKLPKGIKKGKRTAPTEEQMKTILRSVDAPFGLFPYLLLCTGMRKSEALSLLWTDIDFENKKISVTKSLDTTNGANPKYKSPKTESGIREVVMLDILVAPLQAAKKASNNPLVFPCPPSNRAGAGGGLVTDRAYDGLWQRYCTATGMVTADGKPAITAHQLRHGTATLMFESDIDSKVAQATLGHAREEITKEIYTEVREAHRVAEMVKLNEKLSEMLSNANVPQK